MLFGSSGIRRKFDQELLFLSLKTGYAIANPGDRIVAGRDSRSTGPALQDAFMAGAMFCGADVYDGGVAPTPTIAHATGKMDAGCCITASHNPESYNGLKLINPNGSSFTKKQQSETEDKIEKKPKAVFERQGTIKEMDIITPHKEAVLKEISIDGKINMVLDCGCGAGCMITPSLLTTAGVRINCINCNVSGRFPRPSEPLEKNLSYIHNMIIKSGSDGALIHDGDADRFMAFDEKGRFIGGDHLLMLFALHIGAKKVVTTVDASMAIEEIAEVKRTPVGDSFVSEKLIEWGDFGGEPSGSWIFPKHTLCPDGIYAAALFCSIASENKISTLIDEMPDYPILRSSYMCPDSVGIMKILGAENPTDGIRIADEDGWCLIRASGTEPKVRITAEGKTKDLAKSMRSRGYSLLKSAGKKYKQLN
ncbi:phosphopentomutase/phosphoglucosamine mutase [Methanomicrobium antiquum]|uniref:Phosphopentomutase/phosphoglucosamine mutase n=1 Tax=Methanomicrobium antiquum TaxID=487686 RepID=A0AAF0FW95_9EURY|nr:phosphopentomutase/phosphoglucosamine mutase [Methanomicrobium antiquum]WFN36139.1 phosphopentomutase/phosphoglucosamine mutase [Methanomicrobium antiquum]